MPNCVLTLPPIVIPPEPPVPGGGGGNPGDPLNGDTGPLPTVDNSPGRGNLGYVSTLKGLAMFVNAYGSNGTDGSVQWFSANGLAPNNLAGDALKIRRFNLDPWSIVGDHHTAGYAFTDDGLYRVTGLPNNPTWAQILSAADLATLIGCAEADLYWYRTFCVNPRLEGFIGVFATFDSHAGGRWTAYVAWSLDFGATWNIDLGIWLAVNAHPSPDGVNLFASNHLDDTYYLIGSSASGSETYDPYFPAPAQSALVTSGTFPTLVPAAGNPSYPDTVSSLLDFPYCDADGNVYTDDNVLYTHLVNMADGVTYIMRWDHFQDPAWSAGYAMPAADRNAGETTMNHTQGLLGLVSNALDEDYMYAWNGTYLYASPDAGLTWNVYTPITIAGRVLTLVNTFPIPIDGNLLYVTGVPSITGYALPCFTRDGGANWVDISGLGTASAIDTVMGLVTGADLDYSQILIDRRFVGPALPTDTATMIDVSHWQETMNWATASAAGITKTFIKAGDGISLGTPDSQFATNWAGALAQGIDRGAYYYYRNSVDPNNQATDFLDIMNSDYGELGLAVDCEDESNTLDPTNLKIFLDAIETATGVKPTIYTSPGWWNKYVGHQTWTGDYPLWVAHWNVAVPTLPMGWSNYTYWQFSSFGDGATFGADSQFIDVDKVAQ